MKKLSSKGSHYCNIFCVFYEKIQYHATNCFNSVILCQIKNVRKKYNAINNSHTVSFLDKLMRKNVTKYHFLRKNHSKRPYRYTFYENIN